MSRSRSSEAREPYKSVLLLMAERGIKKCIDNLSTDPRLNRQTFKMFQVHLNHLRSLDPNWNIMREFRSPRLVIKMSDIRQRRLRHLYIKLANMIDYVSTLLIDMLDQRSYMILFDLLLKTDKMFRFIKRHLLDFEEVKVPLSVKYRLHNESS